MLGIRANFIPADGGAIRAVTLRIHDVRRDPDGATWSVGVDVLGFESENSVRLKQVGWPEAIEDAARFIGKMVADKVELAGGGTFDPPFHSGGLGHSNVP
jgi:hypothetical protein